MAADKDRVDPISFAELVDKNGRATVFFATQWNKLVGVAQTALSAANDALAALKGVGLLNARKIIAGVGLSGGGDLSADRTIDLNASIDDLTDVDTSSTAPSDGDVLTWVNANSDWEPKVPTGGSGGGGAPNLLHIQDQKPTTTNGGTPTAGVFNTRVLNTVLTNEIGGSSLASNQITLPAGTYYVEAVCPCTNVGIMQARIRDVDSNVTLVLGSSNRTGGGGFGNAAFGSYCHVSGRFSLSVTTKIEIQHFVSGNPGAIGLGTASSSGETEVYTDIRIWDISTITAFPLIHVREEQTSGTSGGSPSTGVRNKRVLNTVVLNTISGAALDSVNDEIDLPAGTYEVIARAPGYRCGRHKAFLRNVTDSADTLIGSSAFQDTGADGDQGDTEIHGRFTIAAAKSFSIEQYFQFNSGGAFTMGVETSEGTNEIYTEVLIAKLA